MGRHQAADEKRERARARALRAAGRSRREIQQELGIGDEPAKAFLRGVPKSTCSLWLRDLPRSLPPALHLRRQLGRQRLEDRAAAV